MKRCPHCNTQNNIFAFRCAKCGAAMLCGMTADKAVGIAIKIDSGSGGPVQSFQVGKKL